VEAFIYNANPGRVVFGDGALNQLSDEVRHLGLSRALVLSTPQQRTQAESVAQQLTGLAAGVYDQAVMHVPVEVAQKAVQRVREIKADGCVAVGGGSTIGLAKAIALETGVPIVAVPTTYAGSEMTPIWGLTDGGVKKTGRDMQVLPRTVIYDPELTLSLPLGLSVTSGMNAIAHCVEALYAQDRNPITTLMAEQGISAMSRALRVLQNDTRDAVARSNALYGAWLAGSVLGTVGMALHHKLCHTLGGSFNLPHAEVHTVMIPHATAYNREAAPEAVARIVNALGSADAATGLYDLIRKLNAPFALKDIGMRAEDLDKAAEIATRNPYYNPRAIDYAGIRDVLQKAYEGVRPE
jgi:maleylacetate reductase